MIKLPEIVTKFPDLPNDYVNWIENDGITAPPVRNKACYADIVGGNAPASVVLEYNLDSISSPFFDQDYSNHVLDIFAKANVIQEGYEIDENLNLEIKKFRQDIKNERLKTYNLLCAYRFINRYPNFIYNLVNYADNTEFEFWSIFYYMSKNFINNYGHNIICVCNSCYGYKLDFIYSIIIKKILSGHIKIYNGTGYQYSGYIAQQFVNEKFSDLKENIPGLNKFLFTKESIFEPEYQKLYDPSCGLEEIKKVIYEKTSQAK